ncbi:MAG: hypothetical protein WCT01_01165 [Candidatus Shapirobacteria bacterium]|jgi:hypothetical protein
MRLQLFDRGTPQGKKLFSDLETICKRLQIDYEPEFVTDMSRVYSRGIQGKTILLINNEVALVDKYPSQKELETLVADYLE